MTVVSVCVLSVVVASCSKEGPTDPTNDDTTVPFGGFMVLDGDNTDYIEIPHSAALNPTSAITLEGWVKFESVSCDSLIGKNYFQAFWVGPCSAFRAYVRGSGSSHDAGTFPVGVWTHWAVTADGTVQRHYINGTLVNEFPGTGPLTASTDPLRIGSDVSWERAPRAALDEFRLWNVARTEAQIQSTMNQAIKSARSGLVAVWPLDTDGSAAVGNHNGTVVGTPVFAQE